MPRFVVLHHVTLPGSDRSEHWDLMLESPCPADELAGVRTLETWALSVPPTAGASLMAKKLTDHREIYLDYEGELSGDRGSVRCVLSGEFTWLERDVLGGRFLARLTQPAWDIEILQLESNEYRIQILQRQR